MSTSQILGDDEEYVASVNAQKQLSVAVGASALPTGAATETTVAAISTGIGTDGATPPSIAGTGVRGWLRGLYDAVLARFGIGGTTTALAAVSYVEYF